jgi:DNA-binding CsgD family transcriptional regulator
VNALHELRGTIEALNPQDLDAQRFQLLSLVDELAPFCPTDRADGKHQRLSPRENEVMSMILNGRRLKEIAAVLDISVKTVTTHRSRLLRKLNVDDNLGLYRYGVRHGLIAV